MVFEFPSAEMANEFVWAVSDYAETAKASHRVVDVELDVMGNTDAALSIAASARGRRGHCIVIVALYVDPLGQ